MAGGRWVSALGWGAWQKTSHGLTTGDDRHRVAVCKLHVGWIGTVMGRGEKLYTGGVDGQIGEWEWRTGRLVRVVRKGEVEAVRAAEEREEIEAYPAGGWGSCGMAGEDLGGVSGIGWVGEQMVAGWFGGRVQVWAEDGREVCAEQGVRGKGKVWRVMGRKGQIGIITAGRHGKDGVVEVWDVRSMTGADRFKGDIEAGRVRESEGESEGGREGEVRE